MTKPKQEAKRPKQEAKSKSAIARDNGPKLRNEKPAEVVVTASACPHCGSTDREGYAGTRARKLSGVLNGRPYKVVIWKPTKCRNCGKRRIDVFHLNRAYRKSDGNLLGPE